MLNNIQIVLVEPSHSGNIGSAARAMKTMGLSHLRLVAPKQPLDEQALALAAGAQDILAQATLFPDFNTAVADCTLVIGTSARLRHLQSSLLEPRECATRVLERAAGTKVALVFGRERVGLSNEELLKCHYHLCFPTNPDYGSLNLAMAVQLTAYEIRMAWLALQKSEPNPPLVKATSHPTAQEMEHFFAHTERVYTQLGFIQHASVMPKLRRLYQRAALERGELNLLRGMLSAIEKANIEKG